jgi:hypothetical protein
VDLIIEFIDFCFMLWCGVVILRFLLGVFVGTSNSSDAEYALHVKQALEHMHVIKEEEHGGQYYWFDKDTDTFLTQGKNFAELTARLKLTHVDHLFIAETPAGKFVMTAPTFLMIPIEEVIKEKQS